MTQGLTQITAITLFAMGLLSGCVSESTYSGTDVLVAEKKFDSESAARQRAQLGLTYLQKGNSQQAKYNLDKAMEFNSDIEAVHVSMAYYYQTVGELENAEASYYKAISTDDASGDAMNNFGVFLCQQGKYKQSEEMFLKAVHMPKYTRSASSYENLGICSRKAGELDRAKKYFTTALKYDSRRQVTLLELTEIDVETGDYLNARAQLVRYHRVVAESAESLTLGINIEQGLNDLDAARKFGILLLAKFPASIEAKQYRASMH